MAVASTRPELACEIVPDGVIAARRQPGSGLLAGAAFAAFGPGAPAGMLTPYIDKDAPRTGLPGVQTGDPGERDAVVQAMRRALESVGGRNGVLTLVIPDTAVRVLMLDFDSLPAKAADAIPLLRFRLKKMVPFDVDDAAVSYQQLPAASGARALVAVLPNAVLREYEAVVREAGFEPGVVMPSTLACLGMIAGGEAALLVHCNSQCVTTAIVNGDELLLHRTQELPWSQAMLAETMNPSGEAESHAPVSSEASLVTANEFVTTPELSRDIDVARFPAILTDDVAHDGQYKSAEELLDAPGERVNQTFEMPLNTAAIESVPDSASSSSASEYPPAKPAEFVTDSVSSPGAAELGAVEQEMQHALAIAAAYFEDSLGHAPSSILVAGAMDARTWQTVLREEHVTLRDLVALEDMGTAISSGLSRAQLGAVCGALRG